MTGRAPVPYGAEVRAQHARIRELVTDRHVLELRPTGASVMVAYSEHAASWRVALAAGMGPCEGYDDPHDYLAALAREYRLRKPIAFDRRPWAQLRPDLIDNEPGAIIVHTRGDYHKTLRLLIDARGLTDGFILIGEPTPAILTTIRWFSGSYGYTAATLENITTLLPLRHSDGRT